MSDLGVHRFFLASGREDFVSTPVKAAQPQLDLERNRKTSEFAVKSEGARVWAPMNGLVSPDTGTYQPGFQRVQCRDTVRLPKA